MASKMNEFKAARMASGMTIDNAAEFSGVSRPTYILREQSPGDFRLSEIRLLYCNMADFAKPVLTDAVNLFISGRICV